MKGKCRYKRENIFEINDIVQQPGIAQYKAVGGNMISSSMRRQR